MSGRGWGVLTTFNVFSQCTSQRAVLTSLEKHGSRGGSVLEFLRKPIAACDFPGGGGGGFGSAVSLTPLDPPFMDGYYDMCITATILILCQFWLTFIKVNVMVTDICGICTFVGYAQCIRATILIKCIG